MEVDPATIRANLEATFLLRLRLASLAGAVVSVVWIGLGAIAFSDLAERLVLTNLTLGVACMAVYIGGRHNLIPQHRASLVGSVLWLIAVGQLTASACAIGGDFSAVAALYVVAAGVIHLERRWLLASIAAAAAIWFPFHATAAPGVIMVVLAIVLAILLHEIELYFFVSLARAHAHDAQTSRDLAIALEDAHRELAERQRVESEREGLREQLLHAQKLEAIGTLAGGVAHDMNNVLAAIYGLSEVLLEDVREDLRPDVAQILDSARRGAELTRNLLGFSRRGKYRKAPIDLDRLVDGVVKLLERTLPKGIDIQSDGTAQHQVEGDAAQLSQAVVNLCLNSADAMEGKGTLGIVLGEATVDHARAEVLGTAPGHYMTITVTDTGCGMTREVQARMFEPFFTTKEQGRGTGLGLAMVYGTVKHHGGAVWVDSEVRRGTAITLYLAGLSRDRVEATPAKVTDRVRGHGLILVVDDEPLVRSVTRRVLERNGYSVIAASNGREALTLYHERQTEIRLVVLDMAMPVMGGAECFAALREHDPKARVLLASGYALERDAQTALANGAVGFLEKPFSSERLLATVGEVLAGKRPDTFGSGETTALPDPVPFARPERARSISRAPLVASSSGLHLGTLAPDFQQMSTQGEIRFHAWLGDQWGLLVSHPRDFTPVCTTELGRAAELANELRRRRTRLLAISIDSLEDHHRWVRDIEDIHGVRVDFPILADPDRKVSRLFDMIHAESCDTGTVRSVFFIDPTKRIRAVITYPASTGRSFAEILRVLDSLQRTDQRPVATPADWQPGDDVVIVPSIADPTVLATTFPGGYRVVRDYLRVVGDREL